MPWADLLLRINLVHVIVFYFSSKKDPFVSCYKGMISYEISLSGVWEFEINGKPRKSMIETLNSLPFFSQDYPPPLLWPLTSRWPWICISSTVGRSTKPKLELEFSLSWNLALTCLTRLLGASINRKGGKECFERERETLAEIREAEGCEFLVPHLRSPNSRGHHCSLTGLLLLFHHQVLSDSLWPHAL